MYRGRGFSLTAFLHRQYYNAKYMIRHFIHDNYGRVGSANVFQGYGRGKRYFSGAGYRGMRGFQRGSRGGRRFRRGKRE